MKKKNLLAKLTLSRETILKLTEQNNVLGGGEISGTDQGTMVKTCTEPATLVKACAETVNAPCCPACRSGANATVAKDFCGPIMQTIDLCFDPA